MRNLDKLFNPRSIAIVGASEEEGKVGNVIAKNILELGYKGKVFLVNPNHGELFGQKAYATLNSIHEDVDLAIIAVPAKIVNEVVYGSSAHIKNFVIISAGFAEINAEGKKREKELLQMAEEHDLNILGPNCLGFIVPRLKLNASFAGGMPEDGNIALVSQSGALAVAMMDIAGKEKIKFSHVISIGNKMQIGETELLEYLSRDEKTKVIALYLEGIRDGARFIQTASKISKPIVILKAGQTERAQKAIASHTGALAGSAEVMQAVFQKTGILQADKLEDFFDLITLISNIDFPRTKSVVIITNAGGPGVLTTDAFQNKDIRLAELNAETKKELRAFLPEESSVENPIDLLGDARADRYEKALQIIGRQKPIGSVICVLTPQDQTPVDEIAQKLIEFKQKSPQQAVLAVFIGGARIKNAINEFRVNGIPYFAFPDRAVEALDKYYRWENFHERRQNISQPAEDSEKKKKAEAIIEKARGLGRSALLFPEAKEIAQMYGLKTSDFWTDKDKIHIFPVVAKVDSDKVLHKTDKKGVILNIKNEKELGEALTTLKNNFPQEKIIIQPMLPRQTELIIGVKKDSIFGPVIIYGLGGIYTEVFKLVDFLVPPLDLREIKNSLLSGRLSFLFTGARGQKPYDPDELVGILQGIGHLVREIDAIKEMDINPLLVYNDGKAAMAVDIKILI